MMVPIVQPLEAETVAGAASLQDAVVPGALLAEKIALEKGQMVFGDLELLPVWETISG